MTGNKRPRVNWFDGHLDLTYIALHGRDLTRDPATCGGTLQPASVTFPTLAAANVRAAYSTLFLRRKTASVAGEFCFENDEQAHAAALRQIDMHRAWESAGHIQHPGALKVTLAMEGATCLRTIDDIDTFHAAGVRM